MPQTFKGRAQVEGVSGAFDVILNRVAQGMKMSQEFDEVILQDEHANDMSWKTSNEKYMGDLSMIIVANAGGTTRATVAASAVFLDPLAVVTISGCEIAAWNTTWQNISGADIDMGNTKVAGQNFKLRRYRDATQNALAALAVT